MKSHAVLYTKISQKIDEINKFLNEDNGKIIIKSFSEDSVLNLKVTGACRNCKRNNHYFKEVIKIMIQETAFFSDLKIQYK